MKSNLKTKWKYLSLFGIGSLIVGVSLLAFGAAAGGIDAIKLKTEPQKVTKTFDRIENLTLSSINAIRVKTDDVDKVTVTYYANSKFISTVNVTNDNKELVLNAQPRGSIVAGFMEAGGYALNARDSHRDYNLVEIIVPKGMKLNKVSSASGQHNIFPQNVELDNLQIKEVDIAGTTLINKSVIESGNMSLLGYSSLVDSTIKNIDVSYDNLYLGNTTLENVTISNSIGNLDTEKSTLKNVTIENPFDHYKNAITDMQVEYDEVDYSSVGTYFGDQSTYLSFVDSTIENLTYKGSGDITTRNSKLLGNIRLEGYFIGANLSLTDKGSETNFVTNLKHGNLEVYPEITTKSPIKSENAGKQLSHTIQNPKATVTIDAEHGDIYLGDNR